MKKEKEDISFKDLSHSQLDALKELYIESRVKSMSEIDLRKFAREVLDLSVRGTVGNEEEKEVWKEMKDHFDDQFDQKLKEVIKDNASEDLTIAPQEKELQKRIELMEQRKQEKNNTVEDMW